jgi:hypothetical protein
MFRLVETDLASTRKQHLGDGTPSLFLNFRALNVPLREGGHLSFQIVTHEIQFVGAVPFGWVDCGFCRGQGEYQPAMTRVDRLEPENVVKECAVRIRVLAVNNHVSARNHCPSKEKLETIS